MERASQGITWKVTFNLDHEVNVCQVEEKEMTFWVEGTIAKPQRHMRSMVRSENRTVPLQYPLVVHFNHGTVGI